MSHPSGRSGRRGVRSGAGRPPGGQRRGLLHRTERHDGQPDLAGYDRHQPDGRMERLPGRPAGDEGARGRKAAGSHQLGGGDQGLRQTSPTHAKHSVWGIIEALAIEFGPHGIRVNSVHPAAIDTDMIQNGAMYRLFRPDLESPGWDDFGGAWQHYTCSRAIGAGAGHLQHRLVPRLGRGEIRDEYADAGRPGLLREVTDSPHSSEWTAVGVPCCKEPG